MGKTAALVLGVTALALLAVVVLPLIRAACVQVARFVRWSFSDDRR